MRYAKSIQKAHGVCRPGRDTAVRRNSFFALLFVLEKSGGAAEKCHQGRRKKHAERAVPAGTNFLRSGKFQKVLILFVRSCCLCELIRGLQNLESPLEKVLILLVRNRSCGALNRGLQNLEAPCKGTSCYFLRRAKSNQKARSDVQKVACGKFLCVGDRRNRENCERT